MINVFIDFLLKIFSFSHPISISLTQICFGILFLTFLYLVFKRDLRFGIIDKKLLWLFLIFFLWNMVSVLVNYSAFPSINKFISKFFGWWHYLIFFVVAVLNYRLKDFGKNNYFIYLFLGASVASFYGIYQKMIKHIPRAEGFFSHALTYGNVLAIILILLYIYLIFRFEWKYIIFLVIFAIGLLFSLSRGPILSLLLTLFVLNIMIMKYKGIFMNFFIVIFLVFLMATNPVFKKRFDAFVNGSWEKNTSAFGTRIVLWKTSISIIKDNPLFGIGYNIKKEFKKRIKVRVSSMAHSHNSYLTLAVYRGLPAVLILLLIYAVLFRVFYSSKDNFIKYAGIGVLLVYLLEGLTEDNFGDSEVLMLFWFIMGLLYSLFYTKRLKKLEK